MAQTTKSKVSQAIARAHWALWVAYQEAGYLRSDDTADELWGLLRELEFLQIRFVS